MDTAKPFERLLSAERRVGVPFDTVFFSKRDDEAYSSGVTAPYGSESEEAHFVVSKRRPRFHRFLVKSTFVVIASMAAIAMLIYLCGSHKIRGRRQHTVLRRLSDDGKLPGSGHCDDSPVNSVPESATEATSEESNSDRSSEHGAEQSQGFSAGSVSKRSDEGRRHSHPRAGSSRRRRKQRASSRAPTALFNGIAPKKRWLLMAILEADAQTTGQMQTRSATQKESSTGPTPSTSAAALTQAERAASPRTRSQQKDKSKSGAK